MTCTTDWPLNAFVAGTSAPRRWDSLNGRLDLGAAPRVIADDGVQLALPAPPNAAHGARGLYGTRTKHFMVAADAGARCDVAFVQPNGSEAPAALRLVLDGAIPAVREYPLMADCRWPRPAASWQPGLAAVADNCVRVITLCLTAAAN